MEITKLREPLAATESDLTGSILTSVMPLENRDIHGLRIDGHLVSDLIAAHGKSA